jgi:NAD(P)-dependent dehydrogenase (short-subunit alcohol dehydrogenase family)
MSIALIAGAGPGLSASVARQLAQRGHHVVLASRDTRDLASLVEEIGGTAIDCDAASREAVGDLFDRIDAMNGDLTVAHYNASGRVQGPIQDLDPVAVEAALAVSATGAFLMAHHATKRMLPQGTGALLFTGASAGVKGFPRSSPFAMGKFALRGLCQSLARELHPQGIHIGHFVIDGGIGGTPQSGRYNVSKGEDDMLDPDAIADTMMALLDQHRSAWTWEVELRPWIENF